MPQIVDPKVRNPRTPSRRLKPVLHKLNPFPILMRKHPRRIWAELRTKTGTVQQRPSRFLV